MKKILNLYSLPLPVRTDIRIIGSKKTILASSFFFLTGISCGVFLELTVGASEKSILGEYLRQYLYEAPSAVSYPNPFFSSLSNNLILLLIIFLAGLSVVGFPVAPAILAYKGMAIGFCTGLIAETLQNKGILLIASTLLPQHMILIPAFILASSAACCHGISALKQSRLPLKKNPKSSSGSYLVFMLFLALMVGLACSLEAILSPIVLSP